ncbi:hypothetical protein B9X79_18345 [Acinetobacter pittii]|nr:hypothetical protein B9X79_18345 [Acinetobacter pittii]
MNREILAEANKELVRMRTPFDLEESYQLLSNNGGKTRRVDRLVQKETSARKRAPPSLTIKA